MGDDSDDGDDEYEDDFADEPRDDTYDDQPDPTDEDNPGHAESDPRGVDETDDPEPGPGGPLTSREIAGIDNPDAGQPGDANDHAKPIPGISRPEDAPAEGTKPKPNLMKPRAKRRARAKAEPKDKKSSKSGSNKKVTKKR